MQILLTFTGFHDPFNPEQADGQKIIGPVLTVVEHKRFDKVYLLSSPKTKPRSEATLALINERHPSIEVHESELLLKDPTNHLGILRQMRKILTPLHTEYPEAEFTISLSSGTPHMHACWLLLVASGEFPAKLIQPQRPEHTPPGKSPIRTVDISSDEFPQITRTIETPDEDTDDEALASACFDLGIIGSDPGFYKHLREASIIARYPEQHVLLLGETGAGKEYFSKLIHHLSPLRHKELTVVNCSGIPENLVESVLFGHVKGAFTGATSNQIGKFSAADGGIIFLDELGELPLSAQAKLLRVLDQGEIEPVGASKSKKINVQVVAATNRDILSMVRDGEFREDLYQRFSSTIKIPSLRERKSDIPQLATHLLDRWNAKHEKQFRLSPSALLALTKHHWSGNIRELDKTVTNSAMFSSETTITDSSLRFPDTLQSSDDFIPEPEDGFQMNAYLDDVKEKLINKALSKTKIQAEAARLLGWTPAAMSNYLARKSKQA